MELKLKLRMEVNHLLRNSVFCKTLLIIAFFIVVSCNERKQIREIETIENCLKFLKNSDELLNSSTFLINPYRSTFEFNNYTNTYYSQYGGSYDGSKSKVLKKIGWSKDKFENKKIFIDSLYKGNKIDGLVNEFSESKVLITFSGIDDIVFVELIKFCNNINIEELTKDNLIKKPKTDVSSLVLSLKNNKVDNIFVDNQISLERQCN